eukprot:TRINITY_DN10636_c0_g1_i3.p1 TRINITY_DN10636_c0_g1~~TRINITY_DN10636_c0_g1_i3.p1  ORF type:complete len:216 (+),score=45.24 TRINITY_DN10636_c0_g1_i3:48-650(+)
MEDAGAVFASGSMHAAGMNRGGDKWAAESVRGDSITWLARTDGEANSTNITPYHNITKVLDSMEKLKDDLDRACSFSSSRSSTQLARYPPGGRYVRHKDAYVSSTPSRRVTILYYPNDQWKEGDGGELRIYKQAPPSSSSSHSCTKYYLEHVAEGHLPSGEAYVDCAPISDRVVIFQSALIDHEVLCSHATRYALTMWLY